MRSLNQRILRRATVFAMDFLYRFRGGVERGENWLPDLGSNQGPTD